MDFVGRYQAAYDAYPDFFAACGSDYFTLLKAAVDAAVVGVALCFLYQVDVVSVVGLEAAWQAWGVHRHRAVDWTGEQLRTRLNECQ